MSDSSCKIENGVRPAPIAVFVFNRPMHTGRMLAGLMTNPEFLNSPLFIFSDGARNVAEQVLVDSVRKFVADFPHPDKTIVVAPTNQGLAQSITQGVTRLCAEFGRVIVVEDDLVVSASFLDFMNTALTRYANTPRVMQISGHMFPVDLSADTDAVFMPVTTSWGWATWQRAWVHMKQDPHLALEKLASRRWRHRFDLGGSFPNARMLAERLAGKNNSWAIWWYFQVFMHNGISLFPGKSQVNNEGFDGSGTHCGEKGVAANALDGLRIANYPEAVVNQQAFDIYARYLSRERGLLKRNYDWIWRLLFPTRILNVS